MISIDSPEAEDTEENNFERTCEQFFWTKTKFGLFCSQCASDVSKVKSTFLMLIFIFIESKILGLKFYLLQAQQGRMLSANDPQSPESRLTSRTNKTKYMGYVEKHLTFLSKMLISLFTKKPKCIHC